MDRLAISDPVRDFVEAVEAEIAGLSAADWVLFGLAFVAAWWIYASMRASVRLGRVEVFELEQDGDGEAPVKALTATLRERLSDGGLTSPPEVPAGAPAAAMVSAVEASVPQWPWISKLLDLLPTPPQPITYKLSGILSGDEPPVAANGSPAVSYWLRPAAAGCEKLATISDASYRNAVRATADDVYLHVVEESDQAVPPWARWASRGALAIYTDGIEALRDGNEVEALKLFRAAASTDCKNLVVRLKIANMQERYAGRMPDEDRRERAKMQASALALYLRVARLEPGLVEARYRASVLAAMLASLLDEIAAKSTAASQTKDDSARRVISQRLATVAAEDVAALPAALRHLAAFELDATLELLQPWYTLIRHGRLRNELELRGQARRELRRTAVIAKHCIWLREMSPKPEDAPAAVPGWRTEAGVLARKITVRLKMPFGGLGKGWQAHYNAACFDALLLARRQAAAGKGKP